MNDTETGDGALDRCGTPAEETKEPEKKTVHHLGKISNAHFGFGGYHGAMTGIYFDFRGQGWSSSQFWGFWSGLRPSEAEWSEEDRLKEMGLVMMRITELLTKANVLSVEQLKNVPVSVEIDQMKQEIVSWRVLHEVL